MFGFDDDDPLSELRGFEWCDSELETLTLSGSSSALAGAIESFKAKYFDSGARSSNSSAVFTDRPAELMRAEILRAFGRSEGPL